MKIVFELVSHRTDDDLAVVDDLEQRYVPALAKADDQFSHECALANLPAGEWSDPQQMGGVPYGLNGAAWQGQVAPVGFQFALENEIKQALQILLGPNRELDREGHYLRVPPTSTLARIFHLPP